MVDLHRLWALIKVSLIYRQPELTLRERKNHKSGDQLIKKFLLMDLGSGALLAIVFGWIFLASDFIRSPGLFTLMIVWFGVVTISQEIMFIYNIFFDSRDLNAYLPLPFKMSELFLAKMLTVFWSTLPVTLPLYVMMLLTAWQAQGFFWLRVLAASLAYLLLVILLCLLGNLLVFSLTRSKFFQYHKKIITFVLLGFSMVIIVFSYALFKDIFKVAEHVKVIAIALPFYKLIVMPSWQAVIFSLLEILGVIGILGWGLSKLFLRDLNAQLMSDKVTKVVKKHREFNNLDQVLQHYNIRLLSDPTLLLQVILGSLMIPLMLMLPGLWGQNLALQNIAGRYYGIFLLVGVCLTPLMYGTTSLGAIIISLDRENLYFIESLPLSLKRYLKNKFKIVCWLQMSLSFVAAVSLGIITHFPWWGWVYFLIGILSATYVCTIYFFVRDWRKRYLEWVDISQLFTRGGGQIVLFLQGAVLLLVEGIIMGIAIFLATVLPAWVINTVIPLVILGVTIWCHRYYHKTFWQQIE